MLELTHTLEEKHVVTSIFGMELLQAHGAIVGRGLSRLGSCVHICMCVNTDSFRGLSPVHDIHTYTTQPNPTQTHTLTHTKRTSGRCYTTISKCFYTASLLVRARGENNRALLRMCVCVCMCL